MTILDYELLFWMFVFFLAILVCCRYLDTQDVKRKEFFDHNRSLYTLDSCMIHIIDCLEEKYNERVAVLISGDEYRVRVESGHIFVFTVHEWIHETSPYLMEEAHDGMA